MTEKLTYQDLKSRKKPAIEVVPVVMDPEIGSRYQGLQEEVAELELLVERDEKNREASDRLAEASVELEELKDSLEECVVNFVFRSQNRETVDEIINTHPPTADHRKEARKSGIEISWNPDTFPPALVAASLVDPELTEEEAIDMWRDDDWNQAELMALFEAAMKVNNTRVLVNLKKD